MARPVGYLPLLGRVLIGVPFMLSGFSKLAAHDVTVASISSIGLPLPQLGWIIALGWNCVAARCS
jgi:putative oxidoreductase